ncbi:hypothetical protein COL24_05285 [Bacillus toyonensis]|nr:hypothetical protein COL24_05285 [Bacillus toyonensis]
MLNTEGAEVKGTSQNFLKRTRSYNSEYFVAVLGMRGWRTQQVKVRPKSTIVGMGGHKILPLDLNSDCSVRLKENKAGRRLTDSLLLKQLYKHL